MDSLVRSIPQSIAVSQNGDGTDRGVITEDAIVAAGRILAAAKCEEERGADHHPRRVEQPIAAPHGIIIAAPMTRAEIESKLLDIVKSEKNIPDDKLAPETALADAGIDSLDALSILFAIEEQFHISIPDDKARSIKTFADMVTAVEELLPAPQ
jgi:acyl carrier protein